MDKSHVQINITRTILDRLENQKVKPTPKWYFVIQESIVWILGLVTTLCGAIAISITLFVLTVAPTRFQPATHESIIRFWIEFIPVLWLVLFVSFIFATDYFLRKTKKGYRYSFIVLTISSITLSVLLGYLGFLIGLGEFLEKGVGSKIPFHTPSQMMVQKIWSQPSKGLLTGKIISNNGVLQTQEGLIFNLDISQLPDTQKSLITEGTYIGLIGTTTAENRFFVCVVIPLDDRNFILNADQFERKYPDGRINTCKGVRPYDRLKTKILNYEN